MSATQDPINERINFLINELEKGVRRRFALAIGVSAGMISDLFSDRKNKPGIDMVRKILTAYPQISTDWLLLGEGEMLKKPVPASISEDPQNISSYEQAIAQVPGVMVPGLNIYGSENINRGIQEGAPVTQHGITIPTFEAPPTPGRKPKQIQPAGMDLVQLVASHDADIQMLKQALAAMQQERAAK